MAGHKTVQGKKQKKQFSSSLWAGKDSASFLFYWILTTRLSQGSYGIFVLSISFVSGGTESENFPLFRDKWMFRCKWVLENSE